MRALLVFAAAAAVALPATPLFAEHGRGTSITIGAPAFVDGTRHHRRHRGSGDILYVDRDYQGDTAWRSDSFNDWWHDQPNRSFPRWMQNNQKCEREWWGGDVLRC